MAVQTGKEWLNQSDKQKNSQRKRGFSCVCCMHS